MSIRKIGGILGMAVVFLGLFGIYGLELWNREVELEFSVDSGFYDETLTIEINGSWNLPAGAEIFYTLDGNEPTVESERYEGEIVLEAEKETAVWPVCAKAIWDTGESAIFWRTYVLGEEVDERYDLKVISLAIDETELYDYETGIFVAGLTYDENIAAGETGSFIMGNYNNRGEEWERAAEMTIFAADGEILAEQEITLGVSGRTSSQNEKKSLKVSAIDDEKIALEFYEDVESSWTDLGTEFGSLRLKIGAGRWSGNLREAVVSRLAQEVGFDGYTTSVRAVVYLNGEYYGICNIQQNFSDGLLKDKYGLKDKTEVEKIKGYALKIMMSIWEKYFLDAESEEGREKLEKIVDMDNYLLYSAIVVVENDIDNKNNSEVWRYVGGKEVGNENTDGRWRFLLYDLDCAWQVGECFDGAKTEVFDRMMNEEVMIAQYMLGIKEYRDKFVTIVLDLLNTAFDADYVAEVVDAEYAKIKWELEVGEEEDWLVEEIKSGAEEIKTAAKLRAGQIAEIFEKYFALSEKYAAEIKSGAGIEIKWNNMKLYENESYVNEYYLGTVLTLTAVPYPGYDFEYWLVNGKKVTGEELALEVKNGEVWVNGEKFEGWKKEEKVTVETVAAKNDINLIISELSAKNNQDWIKLTNIGEEAVNLGEYYLSDIKVNYRRYNLPKITLAAGESVWFYGKNSGAVGEKLNFDLKGGETVYLSLKDEMIDSMYVARMNERESYGRKENSADLVYFSNREGERAK